MLMTMVTMMVMMSMNAFLRCAAMFDSQCNGLAHCDKVVTAASCRTKPSIVTSTRRFWCVENLSAMKNKVAFINDVDSDAEVCAAEACAESRRMCIAANKGSRAIGSIVPLLHYAI